MARSRPSSPATREAAELLGHRVQLARRNRRWTIEELAERVGVSRATLRKVERGDLTVGIGVAFEAAVLVGVELVAADPAVRARESGRVSAELALLPQIVRRPGTVNDDF